MTKLVLSLLVFIAMTQNVFASEKAFTVLISYGFKAQDLVSFTEKFPELKDLDVPSESIIPAGAEFNQSRFDLRLYSEKTEEVYFISKTPQETTIEKYDVPYEFETRTIQGEIKTTLADAVFKETDSHVLAERLAEDFKDDFSTTKGMRAKSFYSFQVQQLFDEGKFIKYGNVLTAQLIVGKAVTRKMLQIDPQTFAWTMLPEDSLKAEKIFFAPVKASRVSSLFNLNRRHPVTRRHQPHNGIDFVATSGTAVYPALDGQVITIARSRSKGKYITVEHDNGYLSTYIHLKSFQKGLKVGMRVELTDQIGEVGRTGYATGPHLHFGVIKDGLFVNPLFLLKDYTYSEKEEHEPIVEDEIIEEEFSI